MRVIFLAEEESALSVNGAYLGLIDGFERACEINPADRVLIEIKPNGKLPVEFIFDEAFLLDPPENVKLYYMRGGVAVYAGGFLRADQSLKVLWQNRAAGSLLTLVHQSGLQLNLENTNGFFMIPLPEALADATFSVLENTFLLEGEKAFAQISDHGEILVLSEGKILSREDGLSAEVPFHDSMNHSAVCVWKQGKLVACTVRTPHEPTPETFALALFESVLIGADPAPFLAENLQEKAGALKDFLGNFRSVTLTDRTDEVGLVYERKPRVFDVRYFRVELSGGKISNIRPSTE